MLRSKTGDWQELAHQFDWSWADLDAFLQKRRADSQFLDQAAKPVLDQIVELSRRIERVMDELDVYITAVDRSVDILLTNKDGEVTNVLDDECLHVEQEAAWLLHRWLQLKDEMRQIQQTIADVQEEFDDYVFAHAMEHATRRILDKDVRT
jgi:hypothetical protein